MKNSLLRALILFAFPLATHLATASQSLISTGAVWKYLDNGSDQGTSWRAPDFNDSAWPSGAAQLGFGDGDETTVIGTTSRPITFYFRRSFTITQPSAISNLTLRLLRDDGAVVYLNSVEVFRSNMPDGPITYTTLALTSVPPEDETTHFYSATIAPHLLVEGANVVAVEVHQVNLTSSDISFDLGLAAEGGSTSVELPVVNVIATDSTASEVDPNSDRPTDPGVFRVVRSGPTNSDLHVTYALSGTASNGVDYGALPGLVELPAGVRAAEIVVQVIDDSEVEGTETVRLTLNPQACAESSSPGPGCYRVGVSNQAVISILDNEPPANRPPTVALVTPTDGAEFHGPTNITLIANGNDPDGYETLQTVEFFAGEHSLGIRTNLPVLNPIGPFVLTWENVAPGDYTLRAVATDDHGAKGTSAPVHIIVRGDTTGPVTLIASGAIWKYLDNGTDQGTAWREPSYNDESWLSGPAQLGYGDGDEATIISYGPDPANKYITTYFRKRFDVPSTAAFASLNARLLEDDGSAVYVNGVEVFRSNLPSDPLAFNTLASIVVENQVVEFSIPPSVLVSGVNLIAVEVHQATVTSSDISFDLSLVGNSTVPPTNHAPFVQLNAPRNGDVFTAPTNIELVAYAQDMEDSYDVTVEFFAGDHSLGTGTFNPTRCAPPYCPNFVLTWSNVPPGNYRLTAKATDKSGASSISAPVEISVQGDSGGGNGERELHVVGVYQGNLGLGALSVNRPGKRVTLFLSTYDAVRWQISIADGTTLEKIFLSGYYHQEVTGVPPGVEIVAMTFSDNRDYIYLGYSLDSGVFYQALPRVCALTHLEISSFHGSYQAPYPTPFVIDSVQNDERLHCNYPQPTPLSQLPELSFHLSFYDGGIPGEGRVFSQNYTLGGPLDGGRLLPAPRVVGDGGGQFYYGAEWQDVFKIDSQAGTADLMQLGADVPELSWPMGVAFDSQRQRILLASLGGEGFLYAYAPADDQWSLVSSMNNLDVDSIEYHSSLDLLYGVKVSHIDYGDDTLYEFDPDGTFRREIRLPVLPFDIGPVGYRSELVSVGDYLVLLVERDPLFASGYLLSEARMYLIDPRSDEVWLTYRRVNDIDGDGVPDSRDHCPNTPPGAIVNDDGCSIGELCPCDSNHPNVEHVQCVIEQAWRFYRQGLITADERRIIIAEAAQAQCGGGDGAVLNVQPQLVEEIQEDGICFVVSGAAGTCVLECSTDMINWRTIQTVTLPNATMEVFDPTVGQDGARFYRLRMQ